MGLQVRIRHALGERLLELPDRDVADPLVIGRARDAHVQIPSVSVSPQHCVLFVHDGQWAVEGITGVTKLNGQTLSEPTALHIGDRIEMGEEASPPTLEIDPIGMSEGRKGPARGMGPAIAYPAPNVPTPSGGPIPISMSRPTGFAPSSYAPPPVQPTPAPLDCDEPRASDQLDWTLPQHSPYSSGTTYSIRKPRKASRASMGLLVIFGALVLSGAVILAYRRTHPPITPVPLPPVATTEPSILGDDAPNLHSKLFEGGGQDAMLQSTTTGPARTPQADAVWDDVVARHYEVTRQGPAIIAFDEYRRLHPGKFATELDRFTDDAVDWIWWQRIAQLCIERDRLIGEIRGKKQDLRAQPAGSFHDRLLKEQADLDAQLDKVRQVLAAEMGYTNELPPDIKNPAQLKELARSRDPATFDQFKTRILRYLRNHHGQLPWEGD